MWSAPYYPIEERFKILNKSGRVLGDLIGFEHHLFMKNCKKMDHISAMH